MNKNKLKHLPVNLILCLPTWFIVFIILTNWTTLNQWWIAMISFYIYLNDVKQSSTEDYFEERIKKLEDSQTNNIK